MIKHGGSPTNCCRDLIFLVSNDMALLGLPTGLVSAGKYAGMWSVHQSVAGLCIYRGVY